ncbi:MAG TPA: MBL fold metallo-hydrolase [Candidatus Dormibacteraeota bacterium]|jgi:Cft2 family RNA processing exonuclease|nr:MBL fold metallo-hydrolase [Candidatus Dormibacteraeota bacterium]
MTAPYPVQYRRGVLLPELGLWLDPRVRRELGVVSHAHGDHIARHGTVVCTEPTYRILAHRTRRGQLSANRSTATKPSKSRATAVIPRLLAYGEELAHRDATLSLHSAGHVLGSAQVLVRHRDVRVLYSGDIKLRAGRTVAALEHVEADVLIVESTFGRPHYRFPPVDSVLESICDFCQDSVRNDRTPVLFGYSLGKGQELLACLADAGLPLHLHPALYAITELYRELGVDLPAAARYDGHVPAGSVLIWPPHLRDVPALGRLHNPRTAYISGWAVDRDSVLHSGCDVAFALSDHCDFDDLCTYVERSGASQVYTLFGFAEDFAHQLRRRGLDAHALTTEQQLTLALA